MNHETQDGTSPVTDILVRVAEDAGVSIDEVRQSIAALIAESGIAAGGDTVTPESLILTLAAQVIDRRQNTEEERRSTEAADVTRAGTENG